MSARNFQMIHTQDPKMKKLLQMADQISVSRAAVLITGESGTGKELLARYIHSKSNRAAKPFFAVNCAALPEGLLESELFGHERGAFTGAEQKKIGQFELANDSTFLLDEISEMALPLQAKLLRVIQEGELQRVGGTQTVPVNVRILATSNRNLAEIAQSGGFREDLYYRLNVIPLQIPALRERPKDVESLSRFFVDASCEENQIPKKSLDVSATEKLLSWDWPGNVRELQNVVERSVLLCPKENLTSEDLLIENYSQRKPKELRAGMTVSEAECLLIQKTLSHTNQNRTQAAKLLGISVRTLRNKLNEYRQGGLNL